jgi:hypothetical protein
VKYWDASGVVPLLIAEASSAMLREVLGSDPTMVCWWGTRIECASAIARYARAERLASTAIAAARRRLVSLLEEWTEIEPDEVLRTTAERVASVHSLRAADAVQLAAALVACDGTPANLSFVCLDTRLREAAMREGFVVVPDAAPRATAVRERSPRRRPKATPARRVRA